MGISIGIGIQYAGAAADDPLWTPANTTTLGWWDVKDEATITRSGSNQVSQWNDKSGNNRHATQTNAAFQPEYDADENSINVETKRLNIPNNIFAGLSEGVVVLAGMQNGLGQGSVWGNYGSTTVTGLTPANNGYHYDMWLSTATVQGPIIEPVQQSGGSLGFIKTVQSRHQTGSALKFFSDGATRGQASVTFSSTASSRSTFGGYGKYNLFEVIFLANDTDRQKAEGYAAWKWGTQSRLAADHPYKSGPPTV